ncbi:MAG TPA: 8-oxo-dGTP diphosphatase [Candidatus Saccharimonadales bacterium]|nr:8-oxo-dGTP diphosphatase [Candidatus Saccharimonadales bacterium]
MKKATLLFLRRDNQVLLAMKKRGFGEGFWNAPGGKAEPGETAAQTAIRECQEEIGVTARNVQLVGHMYFRMLEASDHGNDGYIFTATEWEGEPHESDEMRPAWFDIDKLPYDQMWENDRLWIPYVLGGQLFEGAITTDGQRYISHNIKPVAALTKEGL